MQRTQKPLPSAPLLLCSSAPEAALMISLSPDTISFLRQKLEVENVVSIWRRSLTQSCTSCVQVARGECYQMIFLSGKLCIITFDNGEKMKHGRKFTLRLRLWVRVSQNREQSPSEAIMDSQTVETGTMVSKDVGFDAGKKIKGRKRHIIIDTLGLLIVVVITADKSK